MFLKRLKMRNFKSFAGTTEIPFQPGFTGIAGPNGSGKSNVSDAILFVLGPTSSKALRAERLTHLFFNGGAAKKAASDCEVSLVFDNRDRMLPVESDEVEIARYVKLAPNDPDGYYSYFYVNGRRTTQGEIDSVLSHARLSGDGYNLVQQGDVNRIVTMGPVPRRALLERLAGISQYDEELARAESKRGDLETNLGRIAALLAEIRGRLGGLESQRLQAIQYKSLQEEKRRAEGRLARATQALAEEEVRTADRRRTELQEELRGLEAEAARLESERQRIESALADVEREIARRAGPEGQKFRQELDARRLAAARADMALQTAEERRQELETRAKGLETELAEAERGLSTLVDQERERARALADVEREAEERQRELREATGDHGATQGRIAEARRLLLEAQNRQKERQDRWQEAVQELEAARAAQAAAEEARAQAEEDARTRELELKDLEFRVREAQPSGAGDAKPVAEQQKELFRLKNAEKALQTQAEALAREVRELQNRHFALDARLKERAASGGRAGSLAAVDYLLSLRNLGRVSGIRGTVEELARLDPAHQTALSIAAGPRFQALVVETDQVAEECIRLLRSEKRGRATFLPLNRMLPGRPKGKSLVVAAANGSLGFAIDLVKFDEELRPAFWYVFGETIVMKDLADARAQMGGVRLVTLTGDLIEATGAITGGFVEPGDKGRGTDSARELQRIAEELRDKAGREADARRELERLGGEIRALAEELARRSGETAARGETLKVLEAELATARKRREDARRRVDETRAAGEEAGRRQTEAQGRSETLGGELESLRQEIERRQQEYVQSLPGALAGRVRSIQRAAEEAGNRRLALSNELEALRANLAAARQRAEERRHEIEEIRSKRDETAKQLEVLEKERARSREALEALRTVEETQAQAAAEKSEEKRKLEDERVRVAASIARAQESLRTKRVGLQAETERLAGAQRKLDEIRRALGELPPAEDEAPAASLEELRGKVGAIDSDLRAMGDVNLRAIEEYDQEKSRLDEFESEVHRIDTEKTELHTLVAEIEKKKRAKLGEVVRAVDAAFREIYAELSGGAEGDIALENPEDPLAGGLLIRARLVGKKVQRLDQLSGGEKSLASLAFVFALQRYDPSPLYVFDEVDMSLDGVNAENVGRLLRRNAERAQFVVISLRKVTLKFAHRLFGVTMHGDGCTKIVGLRLEEIVDVDERDRPEPRAAPLAAEAA